jgi:two-component system NtrC family sensor kinase
MLNETVDSSLKQPLSRVHDGAQRASKIVRNLLTFARQQKPERKPTDINSVIMKTVELRAYEAKVSNIGLATELSPVPSTMTDAHQLQQVFLNLIVNAEHAMLEAHGKGRLTIKSYAVDNRIEVVFQDDGPGIQEEHLRRIFDPFFTTKAVGKGTGLGLSICQGIVAEHGGRITAASSYGRGARFTVELPIVTPTSEMADNIGTAPAAIKGQKRVLVIDDEGHLRELLQEILTREGHQIFTAANGKEALAMLQKRAFDLIITDIKMPETDGRELYTQLKARGSQYADRLLFVTGDLMNADTVRFLESTGNPWLAKPFQLDAVRLAVGRALAAKRSQ